MAPKRFRKSVINEENSEKYKNLLIKDVLCPICRSIFIEPVTLPCNHAFCLSCFDGTMENTTLTCPLCRIRIGSWLRSVRKAKNIINVTLWGVIQAKFPGEIRKKLAGDDVTPVEEVSIKLADPGEIKREYEIELEKDRSEIEKQREAESQASAIVIKKLLEDEETAVKIEEETLRLDEEIARRLAKEASNSIAVKHPVKTAKKSSLDKYLITLSKKKPDNDPNNKNTASSNKEFNKSSSSSNSNTASSSKELNFKPVESTSSSSSTKRYTFRSVQSTSSNSNKSVTKSYTATIMCQTPRSKKQCSKAYKHLLLTKTLQCERSASNGSDSGDSIKQEMRYFKPIISVPKSTRKAKDGHIVRVPTIKVPSVHASICTSVTIRAPVHSIIGRFRPHAFSAFARCNPFVMSPVPTPVNQPSIISDSGKVIKQYYNRKRHFYTPAQSCTITSPPESPFLGFERDITTNQTVRKMKNIVNDIAENLPTAYKCSDETIRKPVNNVKETSELKVYVCNNKRKSIERSPRKLNGCHNRYNDIASNLDLSVQEELDLQYAKRLHEELNNPRNRQTRASVHMRTSTVTKTRSSPRKRQTTLDELMTPKKFKI